MTNAQRDKARAHIAEAITEQWGERCRHFDGKCPCCLSWAEWDRLTEDAELNAIADERAGGPTVAVKLDDL